MRSHKERLLVSLLIINHNNITYKNVPYEIKAYGTQLFLLLIDELID